MRNFVRLRTVCSVSLIVMLGVSVWAIVAYGQDTTKPKETPPGTPIAPIPQMSSEERERIYTVRVLDVKDAWKCPIASKKKLEWPSQDKMTDALYSDRSAKQQSVIKWARNFVKWPDNTEVKTLVEKGEENAYIVLKPAMNNCHIRLWRKSHDKTRRYPHRIDLLVEEPLTDTTLESVVGEIASLKLADKADVKNLPKIMKFLKKLPLQERLAALPWVVRGFSMRRDCRLVQIELKAGGPRRPLLMNLSVGPKGLQASIQGRKMEDPSHLFKTKGASGPYDPMRDGPGAPGQTGPNWRRRMPK
ncbi:MAG: hypothetical protein K8S55_01770 [Phycisphaerae bacterium]|nr:hypothetical protein [Phycisphaerae bacterium]